MTRRGLGGLAVALSFALLAGVAVAHTSVAETIPSDGASVEAAPEQVYIRFGPPELPTIGQRRRLLRVDRR